MTTSNIRKKILAICGSLRQGSSNHIILNYLGTLSNEVDFQIYERLSGIPAFDPGLDNDGPPAEVARLRHLLSEADGVVICTPEYAFGIPGALKNSLDWMVSSGSFMHKPVSLVTASTGGENAHLALLKVLGAIDATVIDEATLLISFIRSKINAQGDLVDLDTLQSLSAAYHKLIENI